MSLFNDQAAIAAEIRSDRLILAGETYFPGVTLGDDYLFAKVRAAEADLERRLRVFLEPVEVLPQTATQDERDAFDNAVDGENNPAPIRWVEEPGYDLTQGFFSGNAWGFIPLRHKPAIAVHSIKFIYPQPSTQVFEVPAEWLRLDKKYGQINLVPSGAQSFVAPISTWMMQVMGGGRDIPSMIQVRYRAGLEDVPNRHPDVYDLLKKMAALSVLQDAFLPASTSQSIDGMSQSFSADVDKFADGLNTKVDTLRQSLHGVRMMVM